LQLTSSHGGSLFDRRLAGQIDLAEPDW